VSDVRDKWSAGSTYEDFMGRWSRQLAEQFVSWMQIPNDAHWLDVGCGTGALSEAICQRADPASVVGCDPAEPFIEYARMQSQDSRISFMVAGTGSLPSRGDGYGCVASLLALNFFPNPRSAVREMRSLATTNGTFSACVWDYGDGMEFLRVFWDAATNIDSKAQELDEGVRFPICRSDALVDLFRASDLRDVWCFIRPLLRTGI